jgi:hypothetical protein
MATKQPKAFVLLHMDTAKATLAFKPTHDVKA